MFGMDRMPATGSKFRLFARRLGGWSISRLRANVAVATQWIGTERTALPVFLHPLRCHRACDFHRTRRPPVRTFTLVSFHRHRPGFPSLHIRWGRTLRHPTGCGPSPCTRLSRAPTTMATLTSLSCLGGFRGCFQPSTSALLTIMRGISCVHTDGLKQDHLGGGCHSNPYLLP
jgi:hypothetical protein